MRIRWKSDNRGSVFARIETNLDQFCSSLRSTALFENMSFNLYFTLQNKISVSEC